MLVGICLSQVFYPVMLKSFSKKYDLGDRLFTDHFGIPQYHLSTRYGDLLYCLAWVMTLPAALKPSAAD